MHAAAVGAQKPGEHAQQGSFAAAVFPNDAQHLPAVQAQVKLRKEQPSVTLTGKRTGFNYGAGHRLHPRQAGSRAKNRAKL